MTNQEIVAKFLLESQQRDDVPGRLRKLLVHHIIKGNKLGEEIRAMSVPPEPDEDWRADAGRKIQEQVNAEAVALSSGTQRYAVQALYEGDDKPHGRVIITVQADDADSNSLDTEGPDGQGLVTQAMRHTQFFAQAFSRSTVIQIQSMERQIDKLTRENESLRAERLKSMKVYEELLSSQHERSIELRKEEAKAKAFEQAADKFAMLAPIAINRWAGRTIFPENSPERMIVQQLAQRMTPEKLHKLATSGALDESELIALLEILKTFGGGLKEDQQPAPPANGVAS